MNDLLGGLLSSLTGGEVVEKTASNLGVEKSQAQSALATALPVLLEALNRNTNTKEGEVSLENALKKHDGSVFNNLGGYLNNPDTNDGSKILDHILGGKRGQIENRVGQASGLSAGNVSGLLSSIAPLLLGYLGKNAGGQGAGLGSLLSSLSSGATSKAGGQSLIESILDQDGDGSIVDDVTKMGTSLLGKLFKK